MNDVWVTVQRRRVGLVVGTILLVATFAPLQAQDDGDASLRAFVTGDYAIVGRAPELGAAYNGSARIDEDGTQLILERRIAGRTMQAIGRVEKPSPGEGRVLRFRWTDSQAMGGQAMTMTCLVNGDLDNYARLTCLWSADSMPAKRPGLEAMFPTATWR